MSIHIEAKKKRTTADERETSFNIMIKIALNTL